MAFGMDLEEDLRHYDANRTARRGGEGAVQGEHEVVAGSQCVRQDGLTVDESRPEASVYRVPVMPRRQGCGGHPRYERFLAAGVPPREYPGHVIGRRKKQRTCWVAPGRPSRRCR